MILRRALLSSAVLAAAGAPAAGHARVVMALDDQPVATAPPDFRDAAGTVRLAALQPAGDAMPGDVGGYAVDAADTAAAPEALSGPEGLMVLAQPRTGDAPVTAPGAPGPAAAPPAADSAAVPPAARRDINPFERDIDITVPLTFNRRVLGELDVTLTRDDRFIMDAPGFVGLISPLLTEGAKSELAEAFGDRRTFEAHDLSPYGIVLEYDPTALSILVLRIDPARRAPQSLFQTGSPEEPGEPPRRTSAYLNTDLLVSRRESTGEVQKPSVFLNGAVRYRDVVFEGEVFGRESFTTGEYETDRRFARFVYDQREHFRRWYLGDMDPEFRGRQGYQQMGGLGVVRRRDRFNAFRQSVLRGDRQLLLQSESTVRVLRNGALVREFRLDPGQYDLSNLPLQTGSNNFEVEVRDATGQVQTFNYSGYLDAIDLEPGDYEYGAYLGLTAAPAFGSPDYSDGDVAFTGFWRKAFIDKPAVGVGLQATQHVQNVTGQTQFILMNGSRIIVEAGASNSDEAGGGLAGGVGYDLFIDRGVSADRFAVQLDYVSEGYSFLGNAAARNAREWSATAQYSHAFGERMNVTLSGNYTAGRFDLGDSYRVDAYANYRFNRQWSVQAGVNYIRYDRDLTDRSGPGFLVSLVWQPSFNQRADVRYDSALNSASASYIKSPDNVVGSLGYSAVVNYDDGPASVSANADYIANRFDATLSHTAFGRSFETITDEQVTSVRVGSSIAFAGGKAAVGRRIGDSFAILYGHPTLEGRRVIVGQTLERGRYNAASGALGPAVTGQVGSYMNQSIVYDVEDLPAGYDIGEGIKRIHPYYKSGYAFEVGTAAFVSAVGTLVGQNAKPVSLTSGRIVPADDPEAEPMTFFTNSVGRFAIQGLEPGKAYRVRVFTEPRVAFQFTVPEDNDGLLNLQTVTVPITVE